MTHDDRGDEAAIRELLAGYALALDVGDIDECVQLFEPDGEFLVYGKTFVGHDGIAGMFRGAARGLHLNGSARIEITGERPPPDHRCCSSARATCNCGPRSTTTS